MREPYIVRVRDQLFTSGWITPKPYPILLLPIALIPLKGIAGWVSYSEEVKAKSDVPRLNGESLYRALYLISWAATTLSRHSTHTDILLCTTLLPSHRDYVFLQTHTRLRHICELCGISR